MWCPGSLAAPVRHQVAFPRMDICFSARLLRPLAAGAGKLPNFLDCGFFAISRPDYIQLMFPLSVAGWRDAGRFDGWGVPCAIILPIFWVGFRNGYERVYYACFLLCR